MFHLLWMPFSLFSTLCKLLLSGIICSVIIADLKYFNSIQILQVISFVCVCSHSTPCPIPRFFQHSSIFNNLLIHHVFFPLYFEHKKFWEVYYSCMHPSSLALCLAQSRYSADVWWMNAEKGEGMIKLIWITMGLQGVSANKNTIGSLSQDLKLHVLICFLQGVFALHLRPIGSTAVRTSL